MPSVINNNCMDDDDNSFNGAGEYSEAGLSTVASSRKGSLRKGRKGKSSGLSTVTSSRNGQKGKSSTPISDSSVSMHWLANSNIAASMMNMSSTLATNILMLEAEYRRLWIWHSLMTHLKRRSQR